MGSGARASEILRDNLRRELGNQSLDQSEFARRLGMQKQQLSRYLKDDVSDSNPTLELIERMAGVLGVSVGALLRAPGETTDHGPRECYSRVGRVLNEWEKMSRRLESLAKSDDKTRPSKRR